MTSHVGDLTFEVRDEFQRKAIAERAKTLLCSDVDVSPMVIDGSWGTGKTEFCHKLIHLMREDDTHHLIYIDAFQADHADEPLLTVLAEVLKLIPEGEKRDDFLSKVIPTVRYGLKTLVKAGVSHLLRQDATSVVDNFDRDIQQAADKAIDASVEALLKDHVKAGDSLVALQTTLRELAEEKPIILFVDELDRCRPDFAISMLEIIKHNFSVNGVQFVMVTNTQQLKASINHCYGATVDAQRYLDKFLKFTFALPQMNDGETLASSIHYINLVQESTLLKDSELDTHTFLDLIIHIMRVQSVSLREVETLVRHLEIYQALSNKSALGRVNFGYKMLRFVGVILFCLAPNIAHSITHRKADAKQLADFFGEEKIVPLKGGRVDINGHQVALTMLGQECLLNSELFEPDEGQHSSEWEKIFHSTFARGGGSPKRGYRTDIVRDVIHTLSLNN